MNSDSNFEISGLSPSIIKAVNEKGYTSASPIQLKAIPVVLQGKDLMAAAQTGTGKTAAFTLPVLEILNKGKAATSNQARALILTPTRELADQVGENVKVYGKYTSLRSTVVYGGVKINPQMMKLRKGVDVLIATPGRLLDLYHQNAVKFEQLEILVLDEADKMLELGFIDDISKILDLLPKQRQNLLFSATYSDEIRRFAKKLLNKAVEVSVAPQNTNIKKINQWMCPVDKKKKPALLAYLIKQHNWQQVLVFSKTKNAADKLTRYLQDQGIKSLSIHGNKSQGARSKALADFKQQTVQVLVATDIASRGLDINQLPQVVNFDLPTVARDYIHRIGRTGRAGAVGQAVSLVSADEFDQLTDIEHLIKKLLPRKLIDGFEPRHDVPVSSLWRKDKKPKKPKKQKVRKDEVKSETVSDRHNKQNRNSQSRDSQNKNSQGKKSTGPKSLSDNNKNRFSKNKKSTLADDGSRPPKRKLKLKKKKSR
ncbi:MAG: DEAD/DEAH box helicase [Gammaproteobacteria bacterium]|nr:DEAD/DEAH box helicase [Gammaproteobacteria bacterium]